jgi:DNA-binding CsgD family transcriptional regulator
MLGTEIKIPTFVFICVETLIFFFHLAIYLSRRQDKSRFHFLTLTAAFIFYNVCSGFLPDKHIPVHPLLQNILSLGSGILLATYYFYYLVTELEIVQEKLFRIKVLFGSLLGSLLLGFICSYVLTGSIQFSRQVFIIPPILISIYFCFLTVRFLITNHGRKTDNRPRKLMVYSGYIGVIFMATMPVVVAFGDYQILNNSLVNVSFALACYAYMNQHLYQSKIEYEILQKIGHFNEQQNVLIALVEFNLTTTEVQIACLLAQDKTHAEIAEIMFIAISTARKHASNIFKKTDTANKKEFIDKFKPQNNVLHDIDKSRVEEAVLQ